MDKIKAASEMKKPKEVFFTGAGKALEELRVKKNLSREKLAELAGLDASSVWRYEQDKSPLSIELVRALAKPLGMSATQLMHKCLLKLQGNLATSPFGKALAMLVDQSSGE